jgi:ABC-type Fe3+-hydroxamate transport system substrate-binding protein
MQRLLLSFGMAIVMVAGAAPARAQATKSVSGTITAVTPTSVTVKAANGDMVFAVDQKTTVVAPGGSTKTDAAKAEGKAGPVVTAVLKAGQNVDVQYHEQGMHAAQIRVVSSVSSPAKPEGPKAQTVHGVVTAVSGTSLTVKGDAEWTFAADPKTTVTGTGVGTAGKKLAEEGKKTTLVDLVHEGDMVSVTYKDVDGSKLASTVRITKRK